MREAVGCGVARRVVERDRPRREPLDRLAGGRGGCSRRSRRPRRRRSARRSARRNVRRWRPARRSRRRGTRPATRCTRPAMRSRQGSLVSDVSRTNVSQRSTSCSRRISAAWSSFSCTRVAPEVVVTGRTLAPAVVSARGRPRGCSSRGSAPLPREAHGAVRRCDASRPPARNRSGSRSGNQRSRRSSAATRSPELVTSDRKAPRSVYSRRCDVSSTDVPSRLRKYQAQVLLKTVVTYARPPGRRRRWISAR